MRFIRYTRNDIRGIVTITKQYILRRKLVTFCGLLQSFVLRMNGAWAQYVVMGLTIITIVYGCSCALKETHFKRRLAYSTISNMSYILFGVTLMTPLGLVGALTHFVYHAFMKICSFFCAGAVIHKTEKTYIHELNGLGKKIPIVFSIFTLSSLALMGVPLFAGFISKWNLATAAAQSNNPLAFVGIGALLVSALLTAIYMLTIVFRAFICERDPKSHMFCTLKSIIFICTPPIIRQPVRKTQQTVCCKFPE